MPDLSSVVTVTASIASLGVTVFGLVGSILLWRRKRQVEARLRQLADRSGPRPVALAVGLGGSAVLTAIAGALLQRSHLPWSAMRWLLRLHLHGGGAAEPWAGRLQDGARRRGRDTRNAPFYG